jgi:crotonobetainyl-CoA:carnitine CoA-transferase CaiB-like acyl-CoA transferase
MRVKERSWLIPRVNEITKKHGQQELAAKLESMGIPFAPIAKPWDLLDDPHLKASGGLLETLYMGKRSHIPALPIELDGKRLTKRSDPPEIGQNARELLGGLGYSTAAIDKLAAEGIIALPH